MHDPEAQGQARFRCDFCGQAWTDERPMVEGHRGSLICAPCLGVAYAELVLHKAGVDLPADSTCRLCLERKDEPHWAGLVNEDALACKRCVRQSAAVLHSDDDIAWSKPVV